MGDGLNEVEFVASGHTLFQIDHIKKRIRAIWTVGSSAEITFGIWADFEDPMGVNHDL